MTTRPEKGAGLFYHRDSEGHSDLAPPQYVDWARGEAARLGVAFRGTADAILGMIGRGQSAAGDLYIDYGVSGNHLSRPGLDALRARALSDRAVSHIFVSKRDRLARPDNPVDAMVIEFELRAAGVTIVLMGGTVLPRVARGDRIGLADLLTSLIDYDASGKFRRDLAEKLIHAKIRLATAGFSIGGEPVYGFRRWLCAENGDQKRELEDGEVVKMAGCHVVWLPTATDELRVVHRILDEIVTTPAARIARALNDEGVPSPNAGRLRKVNGVKTPVSGQWTQTTVRNIATHSLLVAVCEYGRRSEGDQLRLTKDGPRSLTAADYHADGKVKTVANADDQVIRTPARSAPVTTPDTMARIRAVLEHRGRHLKGKARTQGEAPNSLGGRVYDLNCGWPMYRYAKRGEWRYACGLYKNSQAKCCNHNTVAGETATRFVLACLCQRLLNPATLAKLTARLHELAASETTDDPARRQEEADKAELATVRQKLVRVGRNMALAETPEERAVTATVFRELKAQEDGVEQRLAARRPVAVHAAPQRQVDVALGTLDRLTSAIAADADWTVVGDAFKQMNAKLHLRFAEVEHGRRMLSVPAGGVVTFGSTPPPAALYTGPTDPAIIKQMLAAGESVTAVPERVVSGNSDSGQGVERSPIVQRGTSRCR